MKVKYMSILIINDNQNNQKILTMLLKKNGYESKIVTNVTDKIQQDFDAIIVDTGASNFDEYDICKNIRSMDNLKNVPVILISKKSKIDEIVKAYASGINDYIIAPFKSDELIKKLQTQITLKSLKEKHAENEIKKIVNEQFENIFTLAEPFQTKDDCRTNHIERVSRYSEIIAVELTKPIYKQNITPEYIKNVKIASKLHDIGKVMLSDEIIFKSDKLTDNEIEQMKMHTIFGYNMLKNFQELFQDNEFIKIAKNIVKYHHERYDGLGYPENLSKEEIPLEARIVAVADSYDNLRTQKTYKDAFSHEKSFEVIKGSRELQFDYLIVKALKQVHRDFEKVWNELSV